MGLDSNLLPCFWPKSNPVDYRKYNIEVPFSNSGGWILSFCTHLGVGGFRHLYYRFLGFSTRFYRYIQETAYGFYFEIYFSWSWNIVFKYFFIGFRHLILIRFLKRHSILFLQVYHYTSYIIGFLHFLPVFFRLTLRLPRKLHPKNPTLYVKIQPQIQPSKKRENPWYDWVSEFGVWKSNPFREKKFFKFKKWRFLFFWKSFLKRVRFWKKNVKTLDMTGF